MYKGGKKVLVKNKAQHLKLKKAGYGHSPKKSGKLNVSQRKVVAQKRSTGY